MVSGIDGIPLWRRPAFALVLLPLLAMVFNWPYLTAGFSGDDLMFLNVLEQDPLPFSRWRGIWSMNDLPFMDHLWWKDWKDPGESGVFWRPIPSLVIECSIRLFGKCAFPLHLLSVLLHGGVSVGLYMLVRNLTGRHGWALLAGLFFVACEDHSMAVGWIAAFPDLPCVFFILLSFLCHVHWLRERRAAALIGSLAALAVAMACKETAAVAPAALVLLTFFAPFGSAKFDFAWRKLRDRILRVIRDPLSWLPSILVLAAYLGLYRAMGLGSINTLVYISPLADPVEYLTHMVPNLPVFWLGTFSPVPPFITMMLPRALPILAVLGLLIFLAWLAALWPFRHRSLILWALITYLAALLPQLGTDASERGLYLPMIPASILMAGVAITIGPLVRRIDPRPILPSCWTRFMGWTAMLGVLIPGALLSALMPWLYLPGFCKPERELRTALPILEQRQPEHVLILNTSGFLLTIYTWDTLNFLSDRPQDVWILSSAHGVFKLERTGNSSFEIRTDRSGWLDNFFARIFRTEPRLREGRRYETALFSATLKELNKAGTDVLAVRFELNRPLDHPGWLFLRWTGESFAPLDIKQLSIGETTELADTSDLWKMFTR